MADTTQGYVPTEIVARCHDRDAYGTMREAYEATHTYTMGTLGRPFRCSSCKLWHVDRFLCGSAR